VLGINQEPVTIKNVEVAIVDKAWDLGVIRPHPVDWLVGKTVAVVGSGPAGLATAQQLTRAGYTVVVYERSEAIGGLLRFGIPEFKMEKRQLDRRLAQMRQEGTVFRPGVDVGSDITFEDLRARFDAVVLAVGSTIGRDLPIPGRQLGGIHQAMEYLPQANLVTSGVHVVDQITAEGKHVVIIGGGDTGADCLGTAHRQRPASVTQLEILTRPGTDRPIDQPWPTYPMTFRVSSAHEEGGERLYSVSTQEFVADSSGARVRALRLADAELRDGRFESVAGTEREIPADLVLLAMGFVGPEADDIVDQIGLRLDARGNIARDGRYMTSVSGVFVAGDAGRGQSLIVWAIAEGRSCASAVDSYLTGTTALPAPIPPTARPMSA
jgi:glutamate synthase (NADPH/NADH) small chain